MPEAPTRLVFEEVLGRGGFGSVYRARMIRRDGLSRRVAIKLLNPEVKGVREAARRTRDEARMLSRLNHDHIIGVFDLTELQGSPALIMEFVEGVDLNCFVRAGSTPPRVALQICARVASALHAAHFAEDPETGAPLRLVHRDVKPGNVLVSVEGGVKLLDFGVAFGDLERESRTQVDQVGTLRYMAPEQFLGSGVGHAADMYALGMVLLELLLGRVMERLPIEESRFDLARRRSLAELTRLEVPASWRVELTDLLESLLSLDPASRPDGAAFRDAALRLADRGPGASLATYARTVVPGMMVGRRAQLAGVPLLSDLSLTGGGLVEDATGGSGFQGLREHPELEPFEFRDSETSSRTMIPLVDELPLAEPTVSGGITQTISMGAVTGPFPEATTGVPASRAPVAVGVLLGLGFAAVVAVAVVLLMRPGGEGASSGGAPEIVATERGGAALEGVRDEVVVLKSGEVDAVTPPEAEEREPAPEELSATERGLTRAPVAATTGAREPEPAEPSAVAATASEAAAAPAAEDTDAVAMAGEAGIDEVSVVSAAAGTVAPEPSSTEPAGPPSWAALSGTWKGSVDGRPATFKLQFDDAGGITGVVQVQVGGSQSVVPLSGRYSPTSASAGSLSLTETQGRNPATYAGKLSGGATVAGSLSVGGKERGELSLSRR